MRPMSPVRNQRPGPIVAAVSSGRRQYSGMTIGPRTWTSPSSPSGSSFPSGSRISSCTVGSGRPADSGKAASSSPLFNVASAAHSVWP